jgi:hypothetical protein
VIIETLKDRRGTRPKGERLRTHAPGSSEHKVNVNYGRYLAEIWIEQEGVWINVNDTLVAAGQAIYQEY